MIDSVLIIDDNEDILEFLSEVLSDTYTVYIAESGEKAQEILATKTVSLIVSDIMMPGIDGFELCAILKSDVAYCHIPIILLTAKNTQNAFIEGLEVGADAYIQKPFSPELLQLHIANLLKNRMKIKVHFSSSPFEDFRVNAQSKTEEAFLKKLSDYIQKNLNDPHLDIDNLADYMNMSRPTFYRKIKSISSLSPKELIDTTRVKSAARLIGEDLYRFSEIARIVGYNTPGLFSRNFKKYFKMTPIEYRNSLHKKQSGSAPVEQ
ncbi:response regulator transcription factor [Mucilaginibacter aquatilis]|uniref:Response regulator n=1 Tax=Mucilaginibacter aquatilis TaxID=1517760 RepID=A0A6I4IR71_9SPHI|nr:DNA-binding response regulator [Mucilaginibacter aquatilis]MVN92973.1 response regulator [Mucilaginibacter aquatilis]